MTTLASLAAGVVMLGALCLAPVAYADDGMFVTGYVETGYTASGVYTHPGSAACPPWMAWGTVVEVDGVGTVTCEDTYRQDLSDRIDVFVATVADARAITGVHGYRVVGS